MMEKSKWTEKQKKEVIENVIEGWNDNIHESALNEKWSKKDVIDVLYERIGEEAFGTEVANLFYHDKQFRKDLEKRLISFFMYK